jgi:hypothetical protein
MLLSTTFSSYKSSLYRQRQKNYPEIPETASDVNLEGKWTETLDSSRFLLHHDRQSNIIIFASDHMLRNLFTVNYNVYSEQLVEDTWTGAEGTIHVESICICNQTEQ